MSHFAFIDKNYIVTQVIVAEQDFINSGVKLNFELFEYNMGFMCIYQTFLDSVPNQYAYFPPTHDLVVSGFPIITTFY